MIRYLLWILLIFVLVAAGCESYRIEYHNRPSFYERASMGELPDQVVMNDGTVIRYRAPLRKKSTQTGSDESGEQFQIREELEDGSIVLRAREPEHVLSNTLTCIRNEEFELLWDQLVSNRTKQSYAKLKQGVSEFVEFVRENRHDLFASLNRMMAGLPHNHIQIDDAGDGVIRCRLRAQFAEPFKFKVVDVVWEDDGFKLLLIH